MAGTSKATKEARESVGKIFDETMRDVAKNVREQFGGTGSATLDALEQMARESETLHVKIYRQNTENQKFELFAEKPDVPSQELLQENFDSMCKKEGERGVYRVEVILPVSEPGKQPIRKQFGPFAVGGLESLPIARSELQKRQADPLGSMFNQMFGLPSQTITPQGKSEMPFVRDMLKHIGDSSQNQSNNMMQMMAIMMMREMMPGMSRAKGEGNNKDPEVLAMKQQLTEMQTQLQRERDQRIQEDRLRQQEARMQDIERRGEERHREVLGRLENKGRDTDLTLELMKLRENSSSKGEDSWLRFMTMAREDNKSSQERFDTLMLKLFEKPDGADQTGKIMNMMMESSVSQLNIMNQIAQSGLLGGGSEHPVFDLIRDGLSSAKEGLETYAKHRYGALAGYDEEDEEDEAKPLPIQVPPAQITGRSDEEADEGEETSPEIGELTDPTTVKQAILSEEELATMEKDHASQQIFKAIKNGNVHEATARIFGQAQAKKAIHQRWLMTPGPLSAQILVHFGLPEYMLSVPQNIIEFLTFMQGGGDPNEWSEDYKPIKQKGDGKMQPSGPTPEFGVTQKEPEAGEKVDPTQPPPGVDPKVVEEQRLLRQKKSMLAKMEQVEENIKLLKAGKIRGERSNFLREEGLLPPTGEEDAALTEISVLKAELRKELGIPDPEAESEEGEKSDE